LVRDLENPEIASDPEQLMKLMREKSQLDPIIEKIADYRKLIRDIESAKAILEEPGEDELKELAEEELRNLEDILPQKEKELKLLLVEPDPMDEKPVIVEIRAGVGGEEAALFAEIFSECTLGMLRERLEGRTS